MDLAPFSRRPEIVPLRKTTADGVLLKRPAAVQRHIEDVLALSEAEILRRARVQDREDAEYLLSECLVYLIRLAVREGRRGPIDDLSVILLSRCERSLRRSVRGFDDVGEEEAREDILGRLALMLVDPGDGADFFEVRFDLALKRLRIDVCRQVRRRRAPLVAIDGADEEDGNDSRLDRMDVDPEALPASLDAEQAAFFKEALKLLTEQERKALVLHHVVGVPIASKKPGITTLVDLLGVSERTVRNFLRRAERKISGPTEDER